MTPPRRYLSRAYWPLALLLAACTTGPAFLPDDYLAEMASSQFQQMKSEMQVSNNSRYNEQVQRVGTDIAQVVNDELPNTQWEFVVFEDSGVNAFAMPGGKIGVNTGLLQLVESDDELAAVLGHEIAHVLYQHANQRMSSSLLISLGQVAAAYGAQASELSPENQQLLLGALGAGAQYGFILPFGRNHESQADEEGLKIAAQAGYDPRAAISFWEKMAAQGGEQPPEFLSTHPSHGRRISDLQEHMDEALEIYRNQGGNSTAASGIGY